MLLLLSVVKRGSSAQKRHQEGQEQCYFCSKAGEAEGEAAGPQCRAEQSDEGGQLCEGDGPALWLLQGFTFSKVQPQVPQAWFLIPPPLFFFNASYVLRTSHGKQRKKRKILPLPIRSLTFVSELL